MRVMPLLSVCLFLFFCHIALQERLSVSVNLSQSKKSFLSLKNKYMPVRLRGHCWLGSRRTHKLELLLSKGEANSASAICLAAAMDKPGLATHQHEAKFGQGRAETASWLARVQQGIQLLPGVGGSRSAGYLSLAGMSLVLCFTVVITNLSLNSAFPAKVVRVFCRLYTVIPFLFWRDYNLGI